MSTLDAIYRVPAIPATPTKLLATGFTESGGGMAANAAVAIARLGGEAWYWGRLGADARGARILEQLSADGVDVAGVRRIPGCVSPSSAILVADDGERLVCAFDDPRLDPDASWLPLDQVGKFDRVLCDVRWASGAAAVLDAAAAAGIPTLLDADIGAPEVLLDLARRATHVVFSESGLAQASGIPAPGAGLARIARSLGGMVGVTLGPAGFLWLEDGRERSAPAPQIAAVDTLGAGDVWHGAFALGLSEQRGIADAARLANVAAAIKCTRPGGRAGAPTRAEVAVFAAGI